ncbi:MAG TPA: MFS transporter [Anaeromyxobacter sp.]|nr:MFS transporter [Anaeromyxobacter sp.]
MESPLRTRPPLASRSLLAGPAGATLAILTIVNLFNYLDRFVVSALVESLKRSELALSDTQAGLLMTGFVVVYMVASPAFGALGDRGARPRLVAAGVFLWSFATTVAGFARSFAGLFLARSAVGIGEAAYGTISPGLLADLFPRSARGRAMAVFFAAIPIGSALGYVVGGLVEQALGWRAAFFVAGVPGLLLAFLCLRIHDPPRGAQDEESVALAPRPSLLGSYRDLLGNRTYLLTVLGYAAYTFAVGGMAFWMPAFLERVRNVPPARATVLFGGIVVATGFVGTFAGGWLGDALLRRSRNAYLWLSGVSTLLAAPLAYLVFTDPRPAIYLPAVVVAELLIFASTGPVNSVIVNVVRPEERATAVALSILCIHLLGDVPSPPLIGRISDSTSLARAVLIVPVAVLLGGAIWTLEAWLGGRGERPQG